MELSLVFFGLLLVLSAFFSASETAFTSLTPTQVLRFSHSRNPTLRLAARLHDQLDVLITTVLIGNNLVNIGASVLATWITLFYFSEDFLAFGTGLITLLVLIFGEVTPKQVAIARNEPIVIFAAIPLAILMYLFFPFSWLLSRIAEFVVRISGGKRIREITLEGILMMVKAAEQRGMLGIEQKKIVSNVFRIQDVPVKAVMTHRTDVFCMNQNLNAKEALTQAMEEGYSRIPLFKDHPETITGILILRDLISTVLSTEPSLPLHRLMKEPFFVPESRKVRQVMLDFQKTNQNIAIVLDEYGGLAGVVTREDLIEEVFGEIYDEDETVKEQMIQPLENGEALILGLTPIHMVEEFTKLSLGLERVATFSGYLTQLAGKMPLVGDVFNSPMGKITIKEMGRHRVYAAVLHSKEEGEGSSQTGSESISSKL